MIWMHSKANKHYFFIRIHWTFKNAQDLADKFHFQKVKWQTNVHILLVFNSCWAENIKTLYFGYITYSKGLFIRNIKMSDIFNSERKFFCEKSVYLPNTSDLHFHLCLSIIAPTKIFSLTSGELTPSSHSTTYTHKPELSKLKIWRACTPC